MGMIRGISVVARVQGRGFRGFVWWGNGEGTGESGLSLNFDLDGVEAFGF